MFSLCSRITIGDKQFSGLFEVNIKRSIYSLMSTATIRIPSRATVLEEDKPVRYTDTYNEIGYMDKVTIELGYNEIYNLEFTGYVRDISTNTEHTEIYCEDQFCKMKSRIVSLSDPTILVDMTSLDVPYMPPYDTAFVAAACGLVPAMLGGTDIGTFTADREPVSTVLARLKDEYDLCVYFDAQERVVMCRVNRLLGMIGKERTYRLGWNVVDEKSLVFKSGESQQKSYLFVCTGPDGEEFEFAYGDPGDDVVVKRVADAENLFTLMDYAQGVIEDKVGSGMSGRMTAFLMPFAEPADQLLFENVQGEPIPGISLVESTEVRFGRSGAKRIIDLSTYEV